MNSKLYLLLFFISLNVNFKSNGQCAVTDREALMTFYNATDGSNWVNNTNWNTTAPLDTWFGVLTNGSGCVTSLDLNTTDNYAGSNNLVGFIPSEIGNLQSLTYLDLSANSLSGAIPAELTNLTNLTYLNLSGNDLSGNFPANIDNLINLTFLHLSDNDLEGNLPANISNLSNLYYFRIYGNQLDGEIPISITTMSSLVYLRLAGNNFTGYIYPEYGNLTNLLSFDISQNNLTGTIPSELGNLTNLIDFRIGQQDLTGTIPESLGNLTNVEVFNIRDTQVSGQIPASFSQLTSIRFLYLSGNQLSGNIPNFIGNLTTLEVLFLRSNYFSGNIPSNFTNLINLQLLSLYENELYGNIPNLTSLPNLNRLYISENAFEFGDFETQHAIYSTYLVYNNNPQANVDIEETIVGCENSEVILTTTVSGSQNTYQWYKGSYPNGILLTDETNSDLIFNSVELFNAGDYYCLIKSAIVTDLTLVRNPIHLSINNSPIANPIDSIDICDDNNDGYANFTLNIQDIESQVLGTQTNLNVSYFDADGNSIILSNPFTNTIPNSQIITVRLTNNQGCYDDTTLTLNVNATPDVDTLNSQTVCDNFILPPLANGNYYSEPNGSGNQLNEGDIITTTQTIYIYNEQNGCSTESEFTITINETPIVDTLLDEIACDNYILETISNGNYFTQPNGGGTQLNVGDTIYNSQTIYIYAENANCSSESSFEIIITETPDIDVLNDEIACDNFVLPYLNNGNYYTQSNGLGTILSEGSFIYNSQTIFIYNENNGCYTESSFNITIIPSTDFSLNLENLNINEGEVTINMMDTTLDYEYSLDGIDYQNNNQYSDLIDGIYTLYVRDVGGCIEKNIDFTIELTRFYIPKYFTPNGDSTNERWVITDNKNVIKLISIYNRYGKLLKQLTASQPWDGTYNGVLMPSSDYWYSIELNNGLIITGHFALKR